MVSLMGLVCSWKVQPWAGSRCRVISARNAYRTRAPTARVTGSRWAGGAARVMACWMRSLLAWSGGGEVGQGGAGQGAGGGRRVGVGELAEAGLVQGLFEVVLGIAQVDGVDRLALAFQHQAQRGDRAPVVEGRDLAGQLGRVRVHGVSGAVIGWAGGGRWDTIVVTAAENDRVQAVGQAGCAVAVQDAAQRAGQRRPVAVVAQFGECVGDLAGGVLVAVRGIYHRCRSAA